MSNYHILFIFEGETSEGNITKTMNRLFFPEHVVICCAFCQDIYHLQRKIEKDPDLDLFVLLQELQANKDLLRSFTRNDFAEIYLFFDYDGHATKADDNKLKLMLDFFVEETENGKLFISYPMVEAIRHILTYDSFKDREVPAKVNIKYKTLVPTESKVQLQNMNGYTLEIWSELIRVHLSKMNWIVNDMYGFPEDRIPQQNLFENQLNKFIRPKETVAVVSGFPAFLKEYFGIQKLQEMIP